MSEEPTEERPVPHRVALALSLSDWGRTGATIVSILGAAVTIIRWTATVDDRLVVIEDKVTGQQATVQAAVDSTASHARMATEAADRANAAVARAENAVTENQAAQGKIVKETQANRVAIQQQTKNVTDLKKEMAKQMESLAWRVRMLEESTRRVEEKQK